MKRFALVPLVAIVALPLTPSRVQTKAASALQRPMARASTQAASAPAQPASPTPGQTAPAPPSTAAAPAGNAETGRKLFASDGCYQCHGYEAQGSTATGPRLGPRPISFAAFSRYVRQPAGQMPPYTTRIVSDTDLAHIYAFLRALPEPPTVQSIPLLK
jgi:mono/diheme cytochrome c family protein